MKHWTSTQLTVLRQIRERYLQGTAGASNYWKNREELALYDSTFAERIGWKIDAALSQLDELNWQPRSSNVLDWGCGSGIAGRRVLRHWPHLRRIAVSDRSSLAMQFASERVREEFPEVEVSARQTVDEQTLLLVSHLVSELPDKEFAALLSLAGKAGEILWIEPGSYKDSRRLIEAREHLLQTQPAFQVVAPCTHRARCGLLTPQNAPHWCHHFASPPSSLFQDSVWMEFGREMGIDLRSLPYSYLVLDRSPKTLSNHSRVIGFPREVKGYLKVLSCQESGVDELMLQKRDAPELFRSFRKGKASSLQGWTLRDGKIVASSSPAD